MGEVRESESEVREIGKGKEVLVMDTPDRSKTQIVTPISKFEESPVFNFLNNLSPIKPAKSVSVTQSMNALSFASLPSVFTSPHVSSLKESRFLRRHQGLDPAKPEFSSDYGNKFMTDGDIVGVVCNDNEQQKIIDPDKSVSETSVERPLECSNPTDGLVQSLNYNCRSPVCQPNVLASSEFMSFSEFGANSREVPFAQVASGTGLFRSEPCTEEVCPENGNAGGTGGDWQAISDVADLLNFDSPMDMDSSKRSFSPAGFYNDIAIDLQNMQPMRSLESGDENETNNLSTQPGEGSYSKEIAEMHDMLEDSSLGLNYMDGNFEQKMNIEPVSHLYRGVRRRCLVFEMVGGRRKHFDEDSNSVSPILKPSEGESKANDKQLGPMRINNDSRCILPGIGLHLNTLAATSKECNGMKQDASVSGRLIIAPGPSTNFQSFKVGQEPFSQSLERTSTQTDIDPGENEVLLLEDVGHLSMHIENEELNQNSPKKKRRRVEHAIESESSCKRCNCKKSKCLKLYCECFAAGVYCVEPCSCQECFNKPIHEETVLATRKQIESRNPLAFAPKVIRTSNSQVEAGDDSSKTPASARHKRGCNCKKSGCLKKYCECYQGGVGCSINCRCERCKNAFGRKDVSAFLGPETEFEEDEIDELEKSAKGRSAHKTAIRIDGEHNADSVPPATPFQFKRPLDQQPMSSNSKPPRSTTSMIGTSSLYSNQGLLGRSNFLPPPKFDKRFETVSEDELPEFLQESGASPAGIKSSSPNSKRVSPPHSDFGTSPNRRSSRKLILQSIPSFPSLTPNKH